jgi:hypothetical protein
MENKYTYGKIYKIISPHTDKCYVGSTIQPLSSRMTGHRRDFKNGKYMTSSEIMKLGDYKIILIENYPCENIEQLLKREQHYIDTLDCVNKHQPTKVFDAENYYKEYHIKNREHKCKMAREYREKNIDKIKKRLKEKIECECGAIFTRGNGMSRHKKTQKHIDWVNSQ